ncbi:MAG: hypothetical protein M3304_05545 [Actinomycetota bacterium]|nr:hypothetical protein [Actinomycetota bacterium]
MAGDRWWRGFDGVTADGLAPGSRVLDVGTADHSVTAWRLEHRDLHTGATLRSSISAALDLRSETARPYLARMLGNRDLAEEGRGDDRRGRASRAWSVVSP